LQVHSKKKYYEPLRNAIQDVNRTAKAKFTKVVAFYNSRIQYLQATNTYPDSVKFYRNKINTVTQLYEQDPDVSAMIDSLIAITKQKPVFSINIAGASSIAFDSSNVSTAMLGRAGAWITMMGAFPLDKGPIKKNYINILACARYLADNTTFDAANNRVLSHSVDVGGKLEFEIGKFTFSGEGLYRFNSTLTNQSSLRANGLLRYRVLDAFYLTASFGQNFGGSNNLITMFGINWGINSGNEVLGTSAPSR
jgi:hypothetical protein